MTRKQAAQTSKPTAQKRSANLGGNKKQGAPFNEQDPERRLGTFEGAGEHALQGGRSAGIVGQTKQKFRTDKRKK